MWGLVREQQADRRTSGCPRHSCTRVLAGSSQGPPSVRPGQAMERGPRRLPTSTGPKPRISPHALTGEAPLCSPQPERLDKAALCHRPSTGPAQDEISGTEKTPPGQMKTPWPVGSLFWPPVLSGGIPGVSG